MIAALAYIASHADLIAAFGDDAAAGQAHLDTRAAIENRRTTFDPLAYLASHADLIAIFGADAEAGARHFIRSGFAEGRSTTFDPLAYLAANPDLIAAFGANADAASRHFIASGRFEQRPTGFDALAYLAANPDLIAAFGADTGAATRHFVQSGFAERRATVFDALAYVAANPDLIAAFGTDAAAATRHFVQSGFAERRATVFDALAYIASHDDLIAVFGTNAAAATAHFIRSGFAEGRAVDFDALAYVAANPDLIAAFGLDLRAATTHFIRSGFAENRPLAFAAANYLAGNADLRAIFGEDEAAATAHFVRFGFAEGRGLAISPQVVQTAFDQAGETLRGGAFDDTLVGGVGPDVIEGRAGSDDLSGGADSGRGPNTFVLDAATLRPGDRDVIRDIQIGSDILDIRNLGRGGLSAVDAPGGVLLGVELPGGGVAEALLGRASNLHDVIGAFGTEGDDELSNDVVALYGQGGDDRLFTGEGALRLHGGSGADVFTVRVQQGQNSGGGVFVADPLVDTVMDFSPEDRIAFDRAGPFSRADVTRLDQFLVAERRGDDIAVVLRDPAAGSGPQDLLILADVGPGLLAALEQDPVRFLSRIVTEPKRDTGGVAGTLAVERFEPGDVFSQSFVQGFALTGDGAELVHATRDVSIRRVPLAETIFEQLGGGLNPALAAQVRAALEDFYAGQFQQEGGATDRGLTARPLFSGADALFAPVALPALGGLDNGVEVDISVSDDGLTSLVIAPTSFLSGSATLFDAATGAVTALPVFPDGPRPVAALAAGGSHVVFSAVAAITPSPVTASEPPTITPGIFLRDVASGQQARVLPQLTETPTWLALSDDGRRVGFSVAQSLVAEDTDNLHDLYEFDSVSGRITLLSRGALSNLAYTRADGALDGPLLVARPSGAGANGQTVLVDLEGARAGEAQALVGLGGVFAGFTVPTILDAAIGGRTLVARVNASVEGSTASDSPNYNPFAGGGDRLVALDLAGARSAQLRIVDNPTGGARPDGRIVVSRDGATVAFGVENNDSSFSQRVDVAELRFESQSVDDAGGGAAFALDMGPLFLGRSRVVSRIEAPREQDWFRLPVAGDARGVVVEVRRTEFGPLNDPLLEIHRGRGPDSRIARNDDGGAGPNSLAHFDGGGTADEALYARVTDFGNNVGQYELIVQTEVAPSRDSGTAAYISRGQPQADSLNFSEHFYRFHPTGTLQFRVESQPDLLGDGLDSVGLRFVNSAGNPAPNVSVVLRPGGADVTQTGDDAAVFAVVSAGLDDPTGGYLLSIL